MDSSKRQARLERRRSQQRQGQAKWLVYIVVGAVVLTGLLILSGQISRPHVNAYTQKNGMTLGDPAAPVTIIEFADFQCGHCLGSYNTTERPLIEQYVDSGQATYTYQIVGFLGSESVEAAEAAYCAADQNFFWEYHDIVFAPVNYSTQNSGGYSEANLLAFAGQISGMDVAAFTQCLTSHEKLAVVDQAAADATTLGIGGTPGFVINGTVLSGEQPLSVLQSAIEAALAAAGSN